MKKLIHSMSAIRLHHLAVVAFGDFLNRVAVVAEQSARFHHCDCGVETLPGGFDDADVVRVLGRGGADVVGFVEVAVEAAVVEGDVYVEDVAVLERAVVGDAVADYFVDAGADGFGEVVIVEGGGVCLL
jgi:hypothetical protein